MQPPALYCPIIGGTLHNWDWAEDAPEIGVPTNERRTSFVETCRLCGATSMYGPRPGHRYLSCRAVGTPQPLCPDTCEDTKAVIAAVTELGYEAVKVRRISLPAKDIAD